MSLLKLPAELLRQVMNHLEPDFFRQDLGRLTLCKSWYPLAQEALFSRVTLEAGDLLAFQKLAADPSTELPRWAREQIQSLSLRFHELLLCGDPPTKRPHHDRGVRMYDWLRTPVEPADGDGARQPVRLLRQLGRLQILKIDLSLEALNDGCRCPDCEEVVMDAVDELTRTPLPFLRELDLTMGGPAFSTQPQPSVLFVPHWCRFVKALLARMSGLKVLHLTLSSACPEIFEDPPPRGTLALERLHIRAGADGFSGCRSALLDRNGQLRRSPRQTMEWARELGVAAQNFAAAMISPKAFRIIWSNEASERLAEMCEVLGHTRDRYVYAWDCLTGEARTFLQEEAWDSEGKLVDLDQDFAKWDEELTSVSESLSRLIPISHSLE